MTEIDMARQYGHNMEVEFIDNKDAFNIGYKAFLAGLKAGKPKWHDLRKDPNDLPENKRNVWCDYGDGYGKGYYNKDDGCWWIEGHLYCTIIDAWCELPQFTDKE